MIFMFVVKKNQAKSWDKWLCLENIFQYLRLDLDILLTTVSHVLEIAPLSYDCKHL